MHMYFCDSDTLGMGFFSFDFALCGYIFGSSTSHCIFILISQCYSFKTKYCEAFYSLLYTSFILLVLNMYFYKLSVEDFCHWKYSLNVEILVPLFFYPVKIKCICHKNLWNYFWHKL